MLSCEADDAERVLARLGRSGVVELRDDETVAEGLRRAREVRVDFLGSQLNAYREDQAVRKAMGLTIQLPRDYHRAMLTEWTTLRKAMAEGDPILTGTFGDFVKTSDGDAIKRELAAFGIAPEAGEVIPGMSDIPGMELL